MWSTSRIENAVSNQAQERALKEAEIQRRLKKSLPIIIQELTKEVSRNDSWAPVLQTAPEAIRAMAICLVASTEKKAGAIEITITGLDSDNKPIQQLYKYLSTNLQHCSDLGRIAFSDAERAMDCLRNYAGEITSSRGMIPKILEMIDDQEEAKYRLRPAMEDLKETAERCKDEAESIQKKFVQLLDFIMALRKATQEQAGKTSKKQGENETRIKDDGRKQTRREEELASHAKEIERLEKQRDRDDAELQEIKNKLNSLVGISALEYLPKGAEPLPQFNPPAFTPPPRDPVIESVGVWGYTKKFLVGESDKTRAEYQEKYQKAREEHEKIVTQRLQEHNERVTALMKLRQDQLDIAQKDAQQRLETAQAVANNSAQTLLTSRKQLEDEKVKSWKIESELARTKIDLQNLRDENMELDEILVIINQAVESLTFMNKCVAGMKGVFTKILDDVRHTMSGPLNKFLKEIDIGVERSGNARDAREIENLEFTNTSKVELIEQALRMQGRLSIVSDVAGIYIQVSQRYIKPAIDKMEVLTTVRESEYKKASAEFEGWCQRSVAEIDRLSKTEKKKLEYNTTASIRTVANSTLAIQAPALNEDADGIPDCQ